ncbi:TPA: hypothetical protein DD394_04755 [bacterium UBP9_UBA11836]|nr:hypothetical protein [bacterium UBP9_UBA11836]
MEIQRGFRTKLRNYLDISQEFTLELQISGPVQCSYCCMAVTSEGVPYCRDYILWSGHTNSPKNEVVYQDTEQGAVCTINLPLIPTQIKKLVFLINIEDDHVMSDIAWQKAELKQNGKSIFVFHLQGNNFKREKLIVCCEVYKKSNEWRLAALSCGYNKTISEIVEEKKANSTHGSPDTYAAGQTTYSVNKQKKSKSRQAALTIKGHILAEPFSAEAKVRKSTSTKILPTKVIPIPIKRKNKNH